MTYAESKDQVIETMARVEHERWSGWMQWLFSKGTQNADGTFTIEAGSVARWRKQMETPYAELSEPEREADRVEVRKTLRALANVDVGGRR